MTVRRYRDPVTAVTRAAIISAARRQSIRRLGRLFSLESYRVAEIILQSDDKKLKAQCRIKCDYYIAQHSEYLRKLDVHRAERAAQRLAQRQKSSPKETSNDDNPYRKQGRPSARP
jgi:hypothetical protein